MKSLAFSRDVLEFLRLLAEHQVRYVVIGGTAVIYHGHARLTGDVDFLYDVSPSNCARMWSALVAFWGGSVPGLDRCEELQDPEVIVQFGRPPHRIDLIASLRTVSFQDAWDHRVHESVELDGERVPVWLLGLEELKRSKREAGRPKDLDDLRHLP